MEEGEERGILLLKGSMKEISTVEGRGWPWRVKDVPSGIAKNFNFDLFKRAKLEPSVKLKPFLFCLIDGRKCY